MEQIYIGDYTPTGYAYIFPKSNSVANVGVGGVYNKKRMEKYFEEFLEVNVVKEQVDGGTVTKNKSGKAPVKRITDRLHTGNIFLTGDAANQNFKPFVEGILPSIICGDLAGKATLSEKPQMYETLLRRTLGRFFDESERITDDTYELFSLNDSKKYFLLLLLIAYRYRRADIDKLMLESKEQIKEILEEKEGLHQTLRDELDYFLITLMAIMGRMRWI